MKVLSIAVLKWKKDTPEPIVLCQECELSQFSYFQKTAYSPFISCLTDSVKQMLTFISRTLLQRTNFSERQSVSHEGTSLALFPCVFTPL